MKAFVFEKKKFQKRLFWLSNFPGAAILNNCDVTWLPYCSETKSDCSGTIRQPSYVTIIQDGGAQEIWKPKEAFLEFIFLEYKRFHWKKIEQFQL